MNRQSLFLAALLPFAITLTPRVVAEEAVSLSSLNGFIPVLAGTEKVALSTGTFESGKARDSASSHVPFVNYFASSVIQTLTIAGEFSESKAPQNLVNINLPGYSPKTMGAYGSVVLCRAKINNGNRVLETKDLQIEKGYWKPLLESAKLVQTEDGAWSYKILKPLEPGHYLITFAKNPQYYWDFDVK